MDTGIGSAAMLAVPVNTPTRLPAKNRSFSDPPAAPSALAPSPNFCEASPGRSKDDHAVPTTPKPMRRPDFHSRGLSLQMPPPSPGQYQRPAPLSPQLDQHNIYSYMQQSLSQAASPQTSLPRHSRGLDFSRACTNLHHSTLPEQSSPDSSPVITQKGTSIPSRKMSTSSMTLDSPNLGSGSGWGSLVPERSTVSSSVGSVNMMASESENSDSEEDASMDGEDNDDPILATPQVHKLQNRSAPTSFAAPVTPGGGGGMWASGGNFSPAAQSLIKTMRRTRVQKTGKRSSKTSSSASGSGYSALASPRTTSPPPLKSIESSTTVGYFGWAKAAQNRRESLALGSDGLHLSSGNDSGDEAQLTAPSTPGVVRRAVTRRGNLLPKTKGFARIRAALQEEERPIDTDTRREAETIRQVRERDNSISDLDLSERRPQTTTAASSPSLLPAVPESAQEDFGNELESDGPPITRGLGMDFSAHASRNSGGLNYWNRFDPFMRTPPPPSFSRQGSSVMSDVNMDFSQSGESGLAQRMRGRAQSSASDASEALAPAASTNAASSGINDDMHLKKFKRRREDDFDIATIKRRAVSPGISAQNSPVLTQSPSQRDSVGVWGHPPERKKDPQSTGSEGLQSVRSSSGGSNVSLPSVANGVNGMGGGLAIQGKKLGLQGMVDTNDGLMKMSIE